MMKSTRRAFLGTAAAGTVAMTRAVYGAAQDRKLKAGLIGCGWYGMVDVKAALGVGGIEMIAICDVDGANLTKSADEIEKLQGSRPKTFKDYNDLLETKGLEILIIATPPHWHALQFIAGLEKGLDVYCEKPLAYDIREGRAMVDAAQKSGRIVQIGFQRRQSQAYQDVKNISRTVSRDASFKWTLGFIIKQDYAITRPKTPPRPSIGTCGAALARKSPTARRLDILPGGWKKPADTGIWSIGGFI